MKVQNLHDWNVSYAQARKLQQQLAGKISFKPLREQPTLIAGIDCAFLDRGKKIIAVTVVLRRISSPSPANKPKEEPSFEIVETSNAVQDVKFPYIPGLLSFREAPACIKAVEKLSTQPELFLIDGQGIAHPRRLGLASHLGLLLDKPTIGCAKSRLTGTFDEPPLEKGSYTLLKDKTHDATTNQYETIGAVVRTRTNVRPLFISVGHKCSLKDAIDLTLACTTRYRLPEPTRLAHQMVSKIKHTI
jgi:deoxyribonuclease V